ncbi:MAG: tRNA dihydrouridine synthase DusB [Bacilli bacterium]|nr:tRNA dihydrouridine synthase DusB [Bacilli bacterium]
MKIGNLELQGNVILGPMAGVTNVAYRDFMKPFGVALSYSEMISDCGIAYGNKRTFDYLETSKIDHPVGLQLFGFDIKNTAKAIELVQKSADYEVLDINLGCPVPKVVKTGAGSAWLRNPEALFAYMETVCHLSEKPVTAKIRLGWDEDSINVEEVALGLEKTGVQALAIHCRTRSQFYAGKADYERIAGLKDQLHIPLIVSGDIFSLEDAIRAHEVTRCDGIMVARGGIGNPFLVTQIDQYFKTGERLPNPTLGDQLRYARQYAKMLIDLHGEIRAVKEMRSILPHFLSGFSGYKKYRLALTGANTQADIEAVFHGIETQEGL